MDQIKQIFSPPVMAAVRYFLTALSPLLAVVGIVALSPQQIDKIITVAQQLGTTVAALVALLGVLTPLLAGAYGTISSTFKSNVERVKLDALDKKNPLAEDAKQALIAATIAQPSVQTIVTDQKTAEAAPSESVVAANTVAIHPV